MYRPAAAGKGTWAPGRVGRVLAALALVCVCLGLGGSGAAAHSQVVATDPIDGARLPVSPGGVSVTFNEDVTLAPGGLRVIRPDGSLADVGSESIRGATVSQAIVPLPPGWYVMAWSIVSADGHVVHGTSSFAVGDAEGTERPASSSLPSGLEWLLWASRGLADLMLLVLGGAAVAWVALGARTRRVRRLWLGTLLVGFGAGTLWLATELVDGGETWLGTQLAWSAVARLALLAVALACLLPRPPRVRAAATLSVLAVSLLAWGGHSTESALSGVTIAIHLLAAVTWLGAAPAVALLLWDRAVPDKTGMLVVRRFSRVATVSLFVLIVGGSASALLLTNGLESGVTTWVWILIAKVAVVGVAAFLGFAGRRRLDATAPRRTYQRLFLMDSSLLVVVAMLSSGLTLVGPHVGHADHDGMSMGGAPRCSMTLGQGSSAFGAAVIADPGTPGQNAILVSGVPSGVLSVTAELSHLYTGGATIDVTLVEGATGWSGSAVLPFTGDWTARVLVRVDTFTEARGDCDLTIAPQ